MNEKKEKIYIVLTGGTICSVPDEKGINRSDGRSTNTRLTEDYLNCSDSPFRDSVEFKVVSLDPDILSENMTVGVWGDLLKIFRKDMEYDCKGIIVLHGTDTLAYTSAFLSLALAGIPVPVCMVSSQLRLGETDEKGIWRKNRETNGYLNFRSAVELIMNGIAPNVYAVYVNTDRDINKYKCNNGALIHYGSHLLQCPNFSNDFHSRDEMYLPEPYNASLSGRAWETDKCLFKRINEINGEVLLLRPYTGLDYSSLKLDGVKAVVHGTYHSESVCIGRATKEAREEKSSSEDLHLEDIVDSDKPYSILYLLDECRNRSIPVFLAPCDGNNAKYGTTANACKAGAIPIGCSNITVEAAYAKAVLGCALGLDREELTAFLGESINYEFS